MIGFPLDDVWHRLFGQDVTLWGPTHLMLIGGAGLSTAGIILLHREAEVSMKQNGKALLRQPQIRRQIHLTKVDPNQSTSGGGEFRIHTRDVFPREQLTGYTHAVDPDEQHTDGMGEAEFCPSRVYRFGEGG